MINNNTTQESLYWLQSTLAIIRCDQTTTYHLEDHLMLDLHIDSLEMLDLIYSIEYEFGVSVNETDWTRWRKVKDIVQYLDSLSGKAD